MKALLVTLFGSYTPVTYQVFETLADGSSVAHDVIASGSAGLDWTWIAGVALFAIVLLSFFKLVGVLLKK